MNNIEKKLIAVVAQRPFTLENGSFCKLQPVLYEDGLPASADVFPNEGEIWWMLNQFTAGLAKPGKLIQIDVEESPNFNKADSTSSMYQAKRDTPVSLSLETPFEIISVKGRHLKRITDLVDLEQGVECDHEPSTHVLLLWNDSYYGPFMTDSYDEVSGTVKVRSVRADRTVYCVTSDVFDSHCRQYIHRFQSSISKVDRSDIYSVSYTLLMPAGYDRFITSQGEYMNMEGVHNALKREAKSCLTRRQRQDFGKLLKLFRENSAKATDTDALLSRLTEIENQSVFVDKALDGFADALLEGGMLGEERLRDAEKRFADQYILDHGAELQAQIQENINVLRAEQDLLSEKLKADKKSSEDRLKNDRRRQEIELAVTKEKSDIKLRAAKEQIDREREMLDDDRRSIQENLQETAKLFADSGDEVTKRFLTFLPLFKEFGLLNGVRGGEERVISTETNEKLDVPKFALPFSLATGEEAEVALMKEQVFFDRFSSYVDAVGFNYREFDLKRFHVSLKCGDLTIIGGPSGIGKSSLMQLYARALSGDDYEAERSDFLMVNVRPSWMETADLIGHVNSLEQRFFPAENGLFQHLICAASEFDEVSSASALYPICLDEMNLAQVEYYFSDFLQIMERQQDARVLNCFSEQTVGGACSFREWSRIAISPAVSFAGTVNFDETTRRLSDRLLDRANLITLRCDELPSVLSGKTSITWPSAVGRRVMLSDMQSWERTSSLPQELAMVIDSLRRPLQELGAPITPRSYQAICRFVASAEPLMTPAQALDAQISQRVLSKVRDIVTESQRHAFENLESAITNSEVGNFAESSFTLEQIRMIEVLDQTDLGR